MLRRCAWKSTGDPFYPSATEVDGNSWRVRINDFPGDLMYSLIIGSDNAGNLHDWPETWQQSSDN